MATLRLSGMNYINSWSSPSVSRGRWETYQDYKVFDYCNNSKCKNSAEHEYAFDGQVFYKKRKRNE